MLRRTTAGALDDTGKFIHWCGHIDLDYDEAMLRYYRRTPARLMEYKGRYRADGTARITQEQRLRQQAESLNPSNPSRVFAWKRGMSAEDRRAFEIVAGDLLKELGYEA